MSRYSYPPPMPEVPAPWTGRLPLATVTVKTPKKYSQTLKKDIEADEEILRMTPRLMKSPRRRCGCGPWMLVTVRRAAVCSCLQLSAALPHVLQPACSALPP